MVRQVRTLMGVFKQIRIQFAVKAQIFFSDSYMRPERTQHCLQLVDSLYYDMERHPINTQHSLAP